MLVMSLHHENVGDDHIDVEENIEPPKPGFCLNFYDLKVWYGLNAEMRDIFVENWSIRETYLPHLKDNISKKI